VFGDSVSGGSNLDGVEAVYTCSTIAAGSSTWAGKAIRFSNGAVFNGALLVTGQVNAKLRETKAVCRTTNDITERWFNWTSVGDTATSLSPFATLIAPADGKITRVTIRPATAGGTTVVRIDVNGVTVDTDSETTSAGTVTHFDFSAGTFSKGDRISVSTDPATAMGTTPGTITIEWDWSTA
jgi:hypothetical protein